MRKFHKQIVIILVLLISQSLYGQKINLAHVNDSINSVLLQNFNREKAVIEIQRIADSTKRTELEKQILELKTTDNLKKLNFKSS